MTAPPGGIPARYAVLELTPSASISDIRQSYRRLALIHHPDRGGDASKMKAINDAYAVLSDPRKRAAYDDFGDRGVEAAESPYTGPVVDQLGMSLVLTLATVSLLCFMGCLIMLLATVSVKVDGVVNWSWTATLFPVWIVVAVFVLFALVYVVVLCRNAVVDGEQSKVTWRNFVAFFAVFFVVATAIMIDMNLERGPFPSGSPIPWLVAFAPVLIVNLVAAVQLLFQMRPAAIREGMLQQGLLVASALDVAGVIVVNFIRVLWFVCFLVLLAVKLDSLASMSGWVVAVPIFTEILAELTHGMMWLTLLHRNEKVTCGQAAQSYVWQLIHNGLPLCTLLLVIVKLEGINSTRTLAVCFIPLFLQCSFYFVMAVFGACYFGAVAKQEYTHRSGDEGGADSSTAPMGADANPHEATAAPSVPRQHDDNQDEAHLRSDSAYSNPAEAHA